VWNEVDVKEREEKVSRLFDMLSLVCKFSRVATLKKRLQKEVFKRKSLTKEESPAI